MYRIHKSCSGTQLNELDSAVEEEEEVPLVSSSSSTSSHSSPTSTLRSKAASMQRAATQLSRDLKAGMGELLNVGPTLAVVGIVSGVFAMASYFLEAYVVTANAALVVFVVGSYVIFSSYFTFDYFLNKLSSSYAVIPEDKKFYVLSNLIKSAVLLAYSPLGTWRNEREREREGAREREGKRERDIYIEGEIERKREGDGMGKGSADPSIFACTNQNLSPRFLPHPSLSPSLPLSVPPSLRPSIPPFLPPSFLPSSHETSVGNPCSGRLGL